MKNIHAKLFLLMIIFFTSYIRYAEAALTRISMPAGRATIRAIGQASTKSAIKIPQQVRPITMSSSSVSGLAKNSLKLPSGQAPGQSNLMHNFSDSFKSLDNVSFDRLAKISKETYKNVAESIVKSKRPYGTIGVPIALTGLVYKTENDIDTVKRIDELKITKNGIRVDYSGGDLRRAELEGAKLDNAIFKNANLGEIDLQNADLSNAIFINANIEEGKLHNAILSNADLSNAILNRADLSNANLSNANLDGVKLDKTNLRDADLVGVDLRKAYLSYTDFFGATLDKVNLEGVDVYWSGAKFKESKLKEANLQRTNLKWMDFTGVDFEDANFAGADFEQTKFEDANFKGAKFGNAVLRDVDFSGAKNLKKDQLKDASLCNVRVSKDFFSGDTYGFTEILNQNCSNKR